MKTVKKESLAKEIMELTEKLETLHEVTKLDSEVNSYIEDALETLIKLSKKHLD